MRSSGWASRSYSTSFVASALLFIIAVTWVSRIQAQQDSNELGRCPKPFGKYGVCRQSSDCQTFCCSRINREPTVGWSGKCCVPRFLAPIVRAKKWCIDKEDQWDLLEKSGSITAVCPHPDDVLACGPTCSNSTECGPEQACCTNACGSNSCVRKIQGNTLQ